jgi:excisionase family DNA binding protein
MEAMTMQAIYTVEQVAGHFGKSPRTVRKWITGGRLPARKVGKGYVVTEDAVSSLVAPVAQAQEDRKAKATEFIVFMQSLDIPRGTMSRILAEDLAAENAARKDKGA